MKAIPLFCLVIASVLLMPGVIAEDHTVTFQNHCSYAVSVNSIIGPHSTFPAGSPAAGTDCTAGQCSGNYCCPASVCPDVKCGQSASCTSGEGLPDGGGFRLNAVSGNNEDTHVVTVKKGWNVAFWGRTGCSNNDNDLNCATGSAISNVDFKDKLMAGGVGSQFPATKGEIKFDGFGNQDFYDISIVDGYNLPIQIELQAGTYKKTGRKDTQYDCTAAGGGADLNAHVMTEAPLLAYNSNGKTVGVYSACKYSYSTTKTENKEYCCLPPYGEYKDRNNNQGLYCNPDTWPANLNSAKLFKKYYPLAYSYADDDTAATFTCTNAGPAITTEYLVTFCSANEPQRVSLPGSDDHTHVPVLVPTPMTTPVPTPVPTQTPKPAQTPVPSAPYNPATSGNVNF
jgi:hypothetical protein